MKRCPAVTDLTEERARHGREHAHPAVGRVGDEEVARRVHRHPSGLVELARRAGEPVAVETGAPGARHGHRGAGSGSQLLDALSGGLRHIDVAVLVDGHPGRVADGPTTRAATSGECGGVPGPELAAAERVGPRRHGDDPAVTSVGDHEGPRCIERDPARPVEDTRPEHGARRPSVAVAVAVAAAAADPAPVTAATVLPAITMATLSETSPARATDSRRTAHIMPVAGRASTDEHLRARGVRAPATSGRP